MMRRCRKVLPDETEPRYYQRHVVPAVRDRTTPAQTGPGTIPRRRRCNRNTRIRSRLTPERFEALARREPRIAAAYEEYRCGLSFANQRTPSTTEKAIEHFAWATALDPEYALAWSALANALSAGACNSDVAPLQVRSRVRDATVGAVRANPDLAEAQYESDDFWPSLCAGACRRLPVFDAPKGQEKGNIVPRPTCS
jgi:hypothetical protein